MNSKNTIYTTMTLKRQKIAALLKETPGQEVLAKGWVRTKRGNKNITFIALNDGSTINNIQIVCDMATFTPDESFKDITTGACIAVTGKLVESIGSGQKVEIQATSIQVYGTADPEKYPLQKKGHSMEFLREIAHLRPRTNTFGAVLRIRHAMAYAIHKYFNDKGFYYLHTPLITASDAEGAGAMFQVTTLDVSNPPRTPEGKVDWSQDFFGRHTNLTVSGQLEGELGAMALGEIYTFGPTFRAENSNTPRHLAEFWMVEPEMAFYEIEDNMDLAEDFIKYLVRYALDNCMDDLIFLNNMIDKGLIERLKGVVNTDFVRTTYYPKDIKAFYMKQNDDGKTVRGMDVLFPKIGEIIGGSQREESYEKLMARIDELHMDMTNLWWYLDTRRFGTAPHSGFGLGFERLLLFVTGMSNIRDVIPFPRTPKSAEF